MLFGTRLMAWRKHRGLTQADLARETGFYRPYISRLERDRADPTLSTISRLASALQISIGKLVDQSPPELELDRDEMDELARGVLTPGAKKVRGNGLVRSIARGLTTKRKALGLYRPRRRTSRKSRPRGLNALRYRRAQLGEQQWKALLRRIDKHAVFLMKD